MTYIYYFSLYGLGKVDIGYQFSESVHLPQSQYRRVINPMAISLFPLLHHDSRTRILADVDQFPSSAALHWLQTWARWCFL